MDAEEIAKGVFRIYTFWKATMGLERARLTPERAKKIRQRLKDGYSIEDVEKAIMGCKDSPFHQGQNDRNTVYNDLTLILRNGSFLEKFMQLRRTLTAEEKANHMAQIQRLRANLGAAQSQQSSEERAWEEQTRRDGLEFQRRKDQAKGMATRSLF
jgi:hypothetical protein